MVVTGLCLGLFATGAAAQSAIRRDDTASRTVKYSAVELQSPARAERLAARIGYAADQVCGGDSLVLRSTPSFQRCRRAAEQRAAAKLNAPLVTAALGVRATELAAR